MQHDLGPFRERGFQVIQNAFPFTTAISTRAFLQGSPDPDRLGQYPLETRLSERLWDIPLEPRLQAIVRDALGSADLYMHMPPMARRIDPGNSLAAVPAHQDIAYNKHLPPFVTVWVPLVEIDEACGGVSVFEGRRGAQSVARGPDWLEALPTDGLTLHRSPPMQTGDVLIFDPLTVHQSEPNTSDHPRLSVDYRFFAEPRSTKHFLDLQSWRLAPPSR